MHYDELQEFVGKMLKENNKKKNARTMPVHDLLCFSLPKRKKQTKILLKKLFNF